jgi:hypothetical protein
MVTSWSLVMILAGGAIFLPVYDYFVTRNNPHDRFRIESFFTDPKQITNYLTTNAKVGSTKEAGRIDALVIPIQELSRDPIKAAFGLGIGNASRSSIGAQFTGRYERLYGIYSKETTFAAFTLEIGLIGMSVVLLMHWILFRDALYVGRRAPGIMGPLAIGYTGVFITTIAGSLYTPVHSTDTSYLFWFISGLIAAARQRMVLAAVAARREPLPAKSAILNRPRLTQPVGDAPQ